jgi:hypothetical protein
MNVILNSHTFFLLKKSMQKKEALGLSNQPDSKSSFILFLSKLALVPRLKQPEIFTQLRREGFHYIFLCAVKDLM